MASKKAKRGRGAKAKGKPSKAEASPAVLRFRRYAATESPESSELYVASIRREVLDTCGQLLERVPTGLLISWIPVFAEQGISIIGTGGSKPGDAG